MKTMLHGISSSLYRSRDMQEIFQFVATITESVFVPDAAERRKKITVLK